jgi:hypothetical protein
MYGLQQTCSALCSHATQDLDGQFFSGIDQIYKSLPVSYLGSKQQGSGTFPELQFRGFRTRKRVKLDSCYKIIVFVKSSQ